MVGGVRYAVAVEPHNRPANLGFPSMDGTVEADDKDAALNETERDYRRRYPGAGKLKVEAVRLRLSESAGFAMRGLRESPDDTGSLDA
jgi:hypothetical protein